MEGALLQLPKELIESTINAHVGAALAAALGDKVNIIDKVVTEILTHKVDSNGKPSRYSGDTESFISWAISDALREAVKTSITDEIKKYESIIKKKIAAELSKKNSSLLNQLVESMTTGIVSAASCKWNLNVTINDKK